MRDQHMATAPRLLAASPPRRGPGPLKSSMQADRQRLRSARRHRIPISTYMFGELIMETIHELIPFAKEMLSQKPSKKMVKIYMLGSVLAFFGVVIGLVETVCSPFIARDDTEEKEKRSPVSMPTQVALKKKEVVLEKNKPQVAGVRSLANRGHAS